jgi:hypothetical protein
MSLSHEPSDAKQVRRRDLPSPVSRCASPVARLTSTVSSNRWMAIESSVTRQVFVSTPSMSNDTDIGMGLLTSEGGVCLCVCARALEQTACLSDRSSSTGTTRRRRRRDWRHRVNRPENLNLLRCRPSTVDLRNERCSFCVVFVIVVVSFSVRRHRSATDDDRVICTVDDLLDVGGDVALSEADFRHGVNCCQCD